MPRCVYIDVLLAIIYLGVLLSIKTAYFLDFDFRDNHSALFLAEEATYNKVEDCNIPDFEPFHPSVKSFLKNPPPINCGEWHFPLTFVDSNRAIYVNESAVTELKKRNSSVHDVKCFYKSISRAFNKSRGHDATVSFSSDEEVQNGAKILDEFILVQCNSVPGDFRVYQSGHAIIQPKPKKRLKRQNKVNVFMFIWDSTSRLNFIRQMPQSYKLLSEDFKAVFMKGLNKVGDNTYPNVMAMLSGHSADETYTGKEEFSPRWRVRGDGYFDALPLVWKNFSNSGYTTFYNEDEPLWNTFNFVNKGFKKQPTDYYARPFWLAMDQNIKNLNNKTLCYAHAPKHHHLLNYTRDFVLMSSKEKMPYFALTISSCLSHGYISDMKVADGEFAAFLKHLRAEGAFNNTLVMILGDHGNRYDNFRKTTLGRVEDRMPLLGIVLPNSLLHFRKHLVNNSQVLTSWYDVHETLLDIATGNIKQDSSIKGIKIRHGERGLSLLRPISSKRKCSAIGIPWEYCVCIKETNFTSLSDYRVKSASHSIVNHINKLIKKLDEKKLCTLPLLLNSTISAQLLDPPNNEQSREELKANPAVYLRVAVVLSPSGAQVEGIVKKSLYSVETEVLGEVNRINLYKLQSECVKNSKLRLYCYCKSYAKKQKNGKNKNKTIKTSKTTKKLL